MNEHNQLMFGLYHRKAISFWLLLWALVYRKPPMEAPKFLRRKNAMSAVHHLWGEQADQEHAMSMCDKAFWAMAQTYSVEKLQLVLRNWYG